MKTINEKRKDAGDSTITEIITVITYHIPVQQTENEGVIEKLKLIKNRKIISLFINCSMEVIL